MSARKKIFKSKPRSGFKVVPELAEVLSAPLDTPKQAERQRMSMYEAQNLSDSNEVQGKHEVACYDLCKVFLMDDANYPCWLVLVPQINDMTVSLPGHLHPACLIKITVW